MSDSTEKKEAYKAEVSCDLKQLVKQEKLDFHGYVLVVIKDMDWEKEVKPFIEKLEDSNHTEFKVMMQDWFRLI